MSAQGTEDRNDSLSEHGKHRDAWSWKRYIDGAGCFVEEAQSTRLARVRVSDLPHKGVRGQERIPGKQMRLGEGNNERKLFERLEKASVGRGETRHGRMGGSDEQKVRERGLGANEGVKD